MMANVINLSDTEIFIYDDVNYTKELHYISCAVDLIPSDFYTKACMKNGMWRFYYIY